MSVAAAANALVTLAELKYAWGRPQTDTSYDDRIQTLINLVSAFVESHTGRKLYAVALDEYYDGNGSLMLPLNEYPINSITSIAIDGVEVNLADSTVVHQYLKEGYVIYESGWSHGYRNVHVVYNAGETPSGVKDFVVRKVIERLEAKSKDSNQSGGQTQLGMKEEDLAALSYYSRKDF